MPTAKATKQNFLSIRLRSRDGHLGRKGAEIQRLAAKTGLSIHMLQSLAMGRREFTDSSKAAIREAMSDDGQA